MASLSKDSDDKNNTGQFQPAKTTVSTRQKLNAATTTGTLPLPTLPFELIIEILANLPVKFLMKLKCVCKSWNSLFSDHKFTRKHLRNSSINPNLILNLHYSPEFSHMVYPLHSLLIDVTTEDTQINNFPLDTDEYHTQIIGACDGIICLIQIKYISSHVVLWNPSIRKYKILPHPCYPEVGEKVFTDTVYGFGYDHLSLTANYKVVVVFRYKCPNSIIVYKTQVKIQTLGTNYWRLIQEFPTVSSTASYLESGKFVSGTLNWLVRIEGSVTLWPIVSLHLGTESYQEILQPDYGEEEVVIFRCSLGVLRDCLCILVGRGTYSSDIWLMKEYGNRESWTKLVSVSYVGCSTELTYIKNVLYISEDDQVLLELFSFSKLDLVVYDPINGTLKIPDVDKFKGLRLCYPRNIR